MIGPNSIGPKMMQLCNNITRWHVRYELALNLVLFSAGHKHCLHLLVWAHAVGNYITHILN